MLPLILSTAYPPKIGCFHAHIVLCRQGNCELHCNYNRNTDFDTELDESNTESEYEECEYEQKRKKRIAENQAALKSIMKDVLPLEVTITLKCICY